VSNLKIDYVVSAGNLPEQQNDSLRIVIDKNN
jgi:hypothetical protein